MHMLVVVWNAENSENASWSCSSILWWLMGLPAKETVQHVHSALSDWLLLESAGICRFTNTGNCHERSRDLGAQELLEASGS